MSRVEQAPLPDAALLQAYAQRPGCYADGFRLDVDGVVGLPDFVQAFYTTPLFRLERVVLSLVWGRPSRHSQAVQLAQGLREEFAAWEVEARRRDQLLMCDRSGRTRSWFMVREVPEGTQLWFGSAVLPRRGRAELSRGMRATLGSHRLYSRALLASAGRALRGTGEAV